jgi:hypothetical protein
MTNKKNARTSIPAHERLGSSCEPSLDGHLHYPDVDRTLNETAADKIRQYRADYNNRPLTLSPLYLIYLVRLGVYTCEFVFTPVNL